MADNFLENQREEYEARKAKKEQERKKRFRRSLEAYKKKLAEEKAKNRQALESHKCDRFALFFLWHKKN